MGEGPPASFARSGEIVVGESRVDLLLLGQRVEGVGGPQEIPGRALVPCTRRSTPGTARAATPPRLGGEPLAGHHRAHLRRGLGPLARGVRRDPSFEVVGGEGAVAVGHDHQLRVSGVSSDGLDAVQPRAHVERYGGVVPLLALGDVVAGPVVAGAHLHRRAVAKDDGLLLVGGATEGLELEPPGLLRRVAYRVVHLPLLLTPPRSARPRVHGWRVASARGPNRPAGRPGYVRPSPRRRRGRRGASTRGPPRPLPKTRPGLRANARASRSSACGPSLARKVAAGPFRGHPNEHP